MYCTGYNAPTLFLVFVWYYPKLASTMVQYMAFRGHPLSTTWRCIVLWADPWESPSVPSDAIHYTIYLNMFTRLETNYIVVEVFPRF